MKHRAEVIFIERPFDGRGLPGWDVRLVNAGHVLDEKDGNRPVTHGGFYAAISYSHGPYGSLEGYGEDTPAGERWRYRIVTQGRHSGGRRFRSAPTVTAAQETVAAWARARFFYDR